MLAGACAPAGGLLTGMAWPPKVRSDKCSQLARNFRMRGRGRPLQPPAVFLVIARPRDVRGLAAQGTATYPPPPYVGGDSYVKRTHRILVVVAAATATVLAGATAANALTSPAKP